MIGSIYETRVYVSGKREQQESQTVFCNYERTGLVVGIRIQKLIIEEVGNYKCKLKKETRSLLSKVKAGWNILLQVQVEKKLVPKYHGTPIGDRDKKQERCYAVIGELKENRRVIRGGIKQVDR